MIAMMHVLVVPDGVDASLQHLDLSLNLQCCKIMVPITLHSIGCFEGEIRHRLFVEVGFYSQCAQFAL